MNFVTLEKIFSNRLFRIPDYQRGYAWRSGVKAILTNWSGRLTTMALLWNQLE